MATVAAPPQPKPDDVEANGQQPQPQVAQAVPVYMATPVPAWQSRSYNTVLLTAPYRSPVNVQLAGLSTITPHQDELLKVYGYSRFVRIIASIDIIFTVIYGIFFPLQLVFLVFPIFGLCSTQMFSAWMAFIYALFQLLQIAGRIVFIVFFHDTWTVFFTIIGIAIEIMIFSLVCKFGVQCSRLTAEDRQFLRESDAIAYLQQSSWC